MKQPMWAVFSGKDKDLRWPLHWDGASGTLLRAYRGAVFFRRRFAAETAKSWPGSRVVKIGLYRETPPPRRTR